MVDNNLRGWNSVRNSARPSSHQFWMLLPPALLMVVGSVCARSPAFMVSVLTCERPQSFALEESSSLSAPYAWMELSGCR